MGFLTSSQEPLTPLPTPHERYNVWIQPSCDFIKHKNLHYSHYLTHHPLEGTCHKRFETLYIPCPKDDLKQNYNLKYKKIILAHAFSKSTYSIWNTMMENCNAKFKQWIKPVHILHIWTLGEIRVLWDLTTNSAIKHFFWQNHLPELLENSWEEVCNESRRASSKANKTDLILSVRPTGFNHLHSIHKLGTLTGPRLRVRVKLYPFYSMHLFNQASLIG